MATFMCFSSPHDIFFKLPLFFSPPKHSSWAEASKKKVDIVCASLSCSNSRPVRSVPLDKHVVRENSILFVQKLKILIQSHPQHHVPLSILTKHRSYLALSDKTCSVHSMILRYPSVFQLIRVRVGSNSRSQLCVGFTPAASALFAREYDLQCANSVKLAAKLQKLLMLSSHHRLLLSKLVHLTLDLGLPQNFLSTLCNRHSSKFRTIDTSFGKAIELVKWDPNLAISLPFPDESSHGLIVERQLKFKQPRMRKGFYVKKKHQEFLMRFGQQQEVCPYTTPASGLQKDSSLSEKRACYVVREVVGMTIGKRTLIDHLAIFRKELCLPNKLRAMILRHPELFYVSCKGLRDSVFLSECFDEEGQLIDKDESLLIRDQLTHLIGTSRHIKRSNRNYIRNAIDCTNSPLPYCDGLDNVIVSDDSCVNPFDDGNVDNICSLQSDLRESW